MPARTARLAVEAVSLDFGNTLIRADWASLGSVVDHTAAAMRERGTIAEVRPFLDAWVEERDRQFREEVPQLREVDIGQRVTRVLARLRGMPPPPAEARWDDAAAAALVDPAEVEHATDVYSEAFVVGMSPDPEARQTLERLHGRGFALAILSNWPLAITIERFVAAHGWLPYLSAVVVSQQIGTIKPHPAIFRAVEDAIGVPGARIVHVGDDWAADVVGARDAGWHAIYLRDRQLDTPLPTSEPGDEIPYRGGTGQASADFVIDGLGELDGLLELAPAR